MRVVRVEKEEWKEVSEDVHAVVFSEKKPVSTERIDFALVVETDHASAPLAYATCRELDSESLYFQYGGSFPGTKGTVLSLSCMRALLEWAQANGYRRVAFLVENTNLPMLKMGMRVGAFIRGVRVFQHSVLLEHVVDL